MFLFVSLLLLFKSFEQASFQRNYSIIIFQSSSSASSPFLCLIIKAFISFLVDGGFCGGLLNFLG